MDNQLTTAGRHADGASTGQSAPRRMTSVAELIGSSREDLIAAFGPHKGNRLYLLCNGG